MKIIVGLFLMCIVFSCRIPKQTNQTIAESAVTNDSIVFISMHIAFDSIQNKTTISVINTNKIVGKLKNNNLNQDVNTNFLTCILETRKIAQQDTFRIEHPLYKDVEYVNDNNQFIKKSIQLKESDFTIRFEKKNYTFIKILETTISIKNNELLKIKL